MAPILKWIWTIPIKVVPMDSLYSINNFLSLLQRQGCHNSWKNPWNPWISFQSLKFLKSPWISSMEFGGNPKTVEAKCTHDAHDIKKSESAHWTNGPCHAERPLKALHIACELHYITSDHTLFIKRRRKVWVSDDAENYPVKNLWWNWSKTSIWQPWRPVGFCVNESGQQPRDLLAWCKFNYDRIVCRMWCKICRFCKAICAKWTDNIKRTGYTLFCWL